MKRKDILDPYYFELNTPNLTKAQVQRNPFLSHLMPKQVRAGDSTKGGNRSPKKRITNNKLGFDLAQPFSDAMSSISRVSRVSQLKNWKQNPLYGFEIDQVRAKTNNLTILRIPSKYYNKFLTYKTKAFERWDNKE